jgi:nucleotide-binding universal stress UspA family protein
MLMTTHTPPDPLVCSNRPLRTVLIGTTLEDDSDRIVRSALAVARTAGARIYLIHAQELTGSCEERLRQQVERLGIDEAELAGAGVLEGAPHRVLVDTAQMVGADLIVVGATGSGPLAAELLGSTADRVLRKATCPVLLVRGELRVPPRRVLAPVDLSTLSADAFRCGLHLLAQLGASGEIEVRAVHALSFVEALEPRRRKDGEVSFEQAERSSAEELGRFVLENRADAPFDVETAVLPGEARFEILRELREHPVDLVVLGTHGRGGLDRLMLGSVASAIARKAPCSVLLISPEAALSENIAEAVLARTTPAWHQEPAPVA